MYKVSGGQVAPLTLSEKDEPSRTSQDQRNRRCESCDVRDIWRRDLMVFACQDRMHALTRLPSSTGTCDTLQV